MYREIKWIPALEDAIDIGRPHPYTVQPVISIGKQPAEFREDAERVDGGKMVTSSQCRNLRAVSKQEGIRHDDKAGVWFGRLSYNDCFEFGCYTGVFMMHCHMMNHEEMGMMQAVEVYKD